MNAKLSDTKYNFCQKLYIIYARDRRVVIISFNKLFPNRVDNRIEWSMWA